MDLAISNTKSWFEPRDSPLTKCNGNMKSKGVKLTWRQPNFSRFRHGHLRRFGSGRPRVDLAVRLCSCVLELFFHRFPPPRPSADLLASNSEVPFWARVSLRLRAVFARMRTHSDGPAEEMSQSLHLLAGSVEPDQKRPGAGGLQLRLRQPLPGDQTSHWAVPAQNQQHGLHRSQAPVRERRTMPKRHGRLFKTLR